MEEMRLEFSNSAVDLWPFAIMGLAVLLVLFWLRKRSLSYLLCAAIFGIYLLFAMQKVFFPIHISGAYADTMKQVPFASFVNLIPFYFGPFGTLESSLVTLIQNVILTIPFGFGLNFVTPVRTKTMLWLALAVGLGIETAQFVISLLLGYPYRFIDINDVLMNALGIWIGYALFRGFSWLYRSVSRRFSIRHRGPAAYIDEITNRV